MSSWKTTVKTSGGRDRQLRKLSDLQRIPPVVSVSVGTTPTTGTVRRVKGSQTISRSAGDNVIILRTQAKQGRDLANLTAAEKTKAADMWRVAFRRAWASPSNAVQAVRTEAQRLGRLLVEMFRRHVGSLRPVSPATQKRKDREAGPGLPPLERTGQLLRSLTSKVKG